jgi:four helix bundle protein
MRDFRKLAVWEKAHAFVLDVYRITSGFPREEQFGLTSQLRRSALSIPSNIAEGCGRSSATEFARFLEIALGSASEAEYQLLLACDLTYLGDTDHRDLTAKVTEVKRMLTSLILKLRSA